MAYFREPGPPQAKLKGDMARDPGGGGGGGYPILICCYFVVVVVVVVLVVWSLQDHKRRKTRGECLLFTVSCGLYLPCVYVRRCSTPTRSECLLQNLIGEATSTCT